MIARYTGASFVAVRVREDELFCYAARVGQFIIFKGTIACRALFDRSCLCDFIIYKNKRHGHS